MPPIHKPLQMMLEIQSSAFVTELIYSFVIILACLMIFFGTKELYKLSKYKGLKYFRYSFLFFALAFFFRYAIKSILFLFNVNNIIEFNPALFGPLTLFVFVYSNSMALFYLLYSLIWKKFKTEKPLLAFHLVSLVLALIVSIIHNNSIYLIGNLIFLGLSIFVALTAYKNSKEKNKQNNLYLIYFLLFIASVLNLVDILIPRFLRFYQSLLYIASISIFLTILYKVLKKTGVN